ncbi:hypothetical protein G6L15_16195 [Agrobacterium rhizogenes]|uniref:hypothetical protein n=1 Tax=Rhizobium rhizogenes TaxID=359 RepID=UPI001574996B|nr:hypothetical protein [Rhizobium rhizogenes]NTG87694.1 hypothetical protein [Rhizobium rhizogenes]
MISDASRYYGSVLHHIIERSEETIEIQRLLGDMPGFYLLNGKLPIYIKYSTTRVGPWSFNFHISHQERQKEIFDMYGDCITAFVCARDGIVALRYSELKKVLDDEFEAQEAITIRRRHNQMYEVKGRNGVLDRKVSRSSLSEIMENAGRS